MQNNNENNGFKYTYSAREQEEIRKMREKYTAKPEKEDDMARLRRLDAGVTQKANAVSIIFGVIGALILGFGMSLVMSDLSEIFGSHEALAMPLGIVIGVVGGILVGLAYPLYNFILKRERQKIAPEIIRLTDELMK